MSKFDGNFDWHRAKRRILDCFHRVHDAWSKEDVSEASEYMDAWYWQNQQMTFLNRWRREGLVNVCDVKNVGEIRPLYFAHRNDGVQHEGSLLVVSITANMSDYLAERDTREVVEGSKGFKDVETIWSFTMIDGHWRVSNIEEDTYSLEYAKMVSDLPKIEETVQESIS